MPDLEKPWIDHLEELRHRLLICAGFLAAFFALGLAIQKQLIALLIRPLRDLSTSLYFTSPAEGFLVALKVAFFFAILAALPVVLWHLWQFVKPGLAEKERSALFPLFLISVGLFLTGVLFCYFLVLPTALKFLLSFSSAYFKPLLSVGHYSSFVGFMLLAFGISFDLPLVVIGLAQLGIVTSAWLRHQRKFVVLGIFILAAILTPSPDVISQVLLAIPLLLLFEATIWVTALLERQSRSQDTEKSAPFLDTP